MVACVVVAQARQGGTAAARSGRLGGARARTGAGQHARGGPGLSNGRRGERWRVRRGARAAGWPPPQERHGGMATVRVLPGHGDERDD